MLPSVFSETLPLPLLLPLHQAVHYGVIVFDNFFGSTLAVGVTFDESIRECGTKVSSFGIPRRVQLVAECQGLGVAKVVGGCHRNSIVKAVADMSASMASFLA